MTFLEESSKFSLSDRILMNGKRCKVAVAVAVLLSEDYEYGIISYSAFVGDLPRTHPRGPALSSSHHRSSSFQIIEREIYTSCVTWNRGCARMMIILNIY
jgi:hypothetical protein